MTQASMAEAAGALRARYPARGARRQDEDPQRVRGPPWVPPQGRDPRPPQRKETQPRERHRVYTPGVKAALLPVWEPCGRICPKRLGPFLPKIASGLERVGEPTLAPNTRRLLVQMSPAMINPLLAVPDIPEEKKIKAGEIYTTLNLAGLQRRLEENLRALPS